MTAHIVITCDTCGHRGTYRTPALAEFHFGRHRCATNLERAARRRRRVARGNSEGVRRDCQHKQADHQHGTYPAFVLDRCRCRPCRNANRDYKAKRTRDQAYGRPARLVDATPAREHLQSLMAAGMGLKRVCEVAGLPHGSVSAIVYGKLSRTPGEARGPRRRISRTLSDALLTVRLDLAAGAKVDGTGTTRRIQALVAVGWSLSKIAAELGVLPSNFTKVAHGRRDVTAGTRKAVAALYDRWNLTPPLATKYDLIAYRRSLAYAKARGWLPPLALDDDRIDDPRWTPDSLSTDGPGNRRLHPEDVEFLLDAGCTRAEILSRLSIAPSSLQTLLTRHGRADLWQRIRDGEERRRTAPRRVA